MAEPTTTKTDEMSQAVRLDLWLDVACLFRTRSEAQRATKGGKVFINGGRAKPNRVLRIGDEICITRPNGIKQVVHVSELVGHHISKKNARNLYTDRTPPLSPEEADLRDLMRRAGQLVRTSGSPGKRQRRQLRKLKGRT